jgi:tetratricopeptide (TPR) repeat protein
MMEVSLVPQRYGIEDSLGLCLPRRALRAMLPVLFVLAILLAGDVSADTAEPIDAASTSASDATPAAVADIGAEEESTARAAVNPQIAERLLRANSYLEKSRLDDALAVVNELSRMRKLKPVDRAQIHRFRGYILISKGQTDDAGRELEAALDENALDEAATQGVLYSLAQIHTQSGRYDRARALIDRWFATAKDPKAEAYFLKAMVLVQQEAYADALEPAKTAIAKAGQPRESWLQLLAAVQFQLQDYASLADTLRQLVAVAPAQKRYWVQLATIENQIGKDDAALATLGVAEIGGLLNDDKELRQRARLAFVRDLPRECADTMESGLAAGHINADADAYQLLANCLIAARDTDQAVGPLAKAGELSADNKGFLLLGQLQLQKERYADARAALEKAKQKAKPGQKPSIDLLIGIAELGSDRFDAAERSFRLASADEKSRPAAESYLRHLEQKRALRRMEERATAAVETPAGSPVSSAAASQDRSDL